MGVVLADSNDLVRAGLRSIITAQTGLPIVGEAMNNEELFEQIKSFNPSIVILDFTSDGFTIDIISKIQNLKSDLSFIAITPEQNAQILVDALRLGVKSYVKKDCELSEIVNAVIETSKGNKFFCGQILETIQKAEIDVNDLDFESFSCEAVVLSERENEIIKLIYLDENEINVLFDKKTLDLKGWKIIDQYNNNINFSLNIVSKNDIYQKGTFKIPEIN